MRYESTTRAPWISIILSIFGVILSTVFFAGFLPVEAAVLLGVTAGMPTLVALEVYWAARYSALPWTPVRLTTIIAVTVGGMFLESEYVDQPIPRALTQSSLPLATLAAELEAQGIRVASPPSGTDNRVDLPSRRPRVRELIVALESQTGLRHSLSMCGTYQTLWSHPYPMRPVEFNLELHK